MSLQIEVGIKVHDSLEVAPVVVLQYGLSSFRSCYIAWIYVVPIRGNLAIKVMSASKCVKELLSPRGILPMLLFENMSLLS